MKKAKVLFFVLMIGIPIIISSCKKNDDNNDPVPAVKKKYAWATGKPDSTGYGMILFSPDAGDTWERQGQGLTAFQGVDFNDIWAVDENNVWVTGSSNTLLKTTDGGKTWPQVPLSPIVPNIGLGTISIVDKTNIWVLGKVSGGSMVYKSTDNGSTWTVSDTTIFHNIYLQGLWAINHERAYVTGSTKPGMKQQVFVAYTNDGGATWDSIPTANLFNNWNGIGAVASGNTIVIYGTTANYMVSYDSGNTWKHDTIPNTGGGGTGGADINDLIMLDSQTWWGALDMGHVFITTDGGTSWTNQQTPNVGGSFLVGIDNWDSQLALVVGYGFYNPPISPIIQTTNGGTLWEKKYDSNTQFWKVTFIKD
jgi:photosystem II stability/assembly factor-like uncharacterized protein